MSELNYTPGPWKLDAHNDLDYHYVVQPSTDDTLTLVYKCTVEGQGEANARLVATAPDLLELAIKGGNMRAAQKLYFETRKREDLIPSKQAEAAFDKALAAVQAKLAGDGS